LSVTRGIAQCLKGDCAELGVVAQCLKGDCAELGVVAQCLKGDCAESGIVTIGSIVFFSPKQIDLFDLRKPQFIFSQRFVSNHMNWPFYKAGHVRRRFRPRSGQTRNLEVKLRMNLNSTQQCTDMDELLRPVSHDSPSGDPHCYSRNLRERFLALRKPESPSGDDDTSFRRAADWEEIIELAHTALANQTKDLRIVCHLIEAETKQNGFAGLRNGLGLLTSFVADCWDRCNPPVDDGDVEVRTAPIENMLDDEQRGICFPVSVRQIPLLGDDKINCGFIEYQKLKNSKDNEKQKELDEILSATDARQFSELAGNINATLESLDELKIVLDTKLDEMAPGLTYLKAAIQDCQRLVKEYLPKLTVIENDDCSIAECDSLDTAPSRTHESIDEPQSTNQTVQKQAMKSRTDAYRQLSEAAEFLQKIEPHSPIPYLVFRAVELGRLPFPKLVTQLVREEQILSELRREFGIDDVKEE